MATLVTDNGAVALYDSVRMVAFGPVFDSSEHAEDFLSWTRERNASIGSKTPAAVILNWEAEWRKARCDEDGYLIEAGS